MGLSFCSDRKDIVYSHEYRNSEQFNSKYTFDEVIGRGCYSKVKLAYENSTHKKVAVKMTQKAEILKHNLYSQIKREKEILLRLKQSSHPSAGFIVSLIQCGQDFEHLFFVMNYASLGNLRQLLKQKKVLQMQKISKYINPTIEFIAVCIILALEELERQGIVHGDIKPQNVLIQQNGYFLLGDFSSAQYINCWNHQIRGTKGYIAPEIKQIEKFKVKDNKIDLYSLGALLWELAHGAKYSSYAKNNKLLLKEAELTGESSDDSQDTPFIDPAFEEFVSLLLRQNPLQRPTIGQLWTHSWLNMQSNQIDLYLHKKVSPHPFQPLSGCFQNTKTYINNYSPKLKNKINDQETDSLLSSVLLSQKRFQNLFASFSNMDDSKRRSKKNEI